MFGWLSKNRQRLLQWAGTILAFGLLVILVENEGWQEVLAAFGKIKPADLLWVALLFLIARLATVGRWYVLLRSGGIDMSIKDAAALTFTGLFASNFLPTTVGGDVVRLAGAMQMGFDRAVCLASIAADRLIGMLGMTMMAPVGLAYSWNILQTPTLSSLLALFKKPLEFLKRTLSVFGIWLKKPTSLLKSLFFAWVNMLCLFAAIDIFVTDLGSHVSFWMIGGLWSLTYFVTLIPISINGYGVQELSFTFLMSNVAGLDPAVSLSVAVLMRVYFILSSLPGAFFLPNILSVMAEQKKGTALTDAFR
jgi:uncharacterized membrane protein YbhN (UPF0104 family)